MADETKTDPQRAATTKSDSTATKADSDSPDLTANNATKAVTTDEPVSGDFPAEGQTVSKDGEFDGSTRYEGTVLVERKVGDDWVSVMTDKPRPGDKVQAHTLDMESGELTTSTESTTKSGAARMPGKS